ncbi:RHS repeat-associated core domain-containing protein [Thauera sinica]|uniref:RHS repeat-associated core domain-containing protein n=1 Tax=Thauera sinica TaxID=2665146 RepID=A0ABW1AP61_9RHOO|nr:type IV secretion protein Rhs [Thauera sp. K11]
MARNQAGQVVWRWESDAFGSTAANEDPAGTGTSTTVNLRFPGQYFDAESGPHYNWHRYYDPRTGRYISSDPIGLEGGINTYSYVGGNPISEVDPLGLTTFACKVPLDALGGGDGQRTGPDLRGNPLYHEYLCIVRNGIVECGGQTRNHGSPPNPSWMPAWWPYGPGAPSNDSYSENQCEKKRDDDDCYESCLSSEFKRPRPFYGVIGMGTNCQEWVSDISKRCENQCEKK